MLQGPPFFVPGSKPGKDEELYAYLAASCNSGVPSHDARIFSIQFLHDGIEWRATVGETLTGTSRSTRRGRGQNIERTLSHGDSATVLAIFAGVPYMVVTDGFRTRWANPFLAGQPRSVVYFSTVKTRAAGETA